LFNTNVRYSNPPVSEQLMSRLIYVKRRN